jgi:cell division transport system permease protein
MALRETKRIFRSGLKNFARSGTVSFASILISTITLFVVAGLIFTQAVLHHSLNQIEEKVDVTVYFTTSADEEKIFTIKESLEALPEVLLVSYTSSDEALASFRARHQNDYLTLQALDELSENPLGGSLNVKAKDPSQYESIVNLLEGEGGLAKDGAQIIDKINYHQNKVVIDRLNSIINGAKSLGFFVTLVLVVMSIVIMFNTIRLTIHFTREEISIMRLVGAENKYIRGPFIVEGMLYGVVATIATLIIYVPVTLWFKNKMVDFLGIDLWSYYMSNFFQIFFIILIAGLLLGAISSFFAVRKYLRN